VVEEMLSAPRPTRPGPRSWPEFGLQETGYKLSDVQAQAILDMRLARLHGPEQDKIVAELQGA